MDLIEDAGGAAAGTRLPHPDVLIRTNSGAALAPTRGGEFHDTSKGNVFVGIAQNGKERGEVREGIACTVAMPGHLRLSLQGSQQGQRRKRRRRMKLHLTWLFLAIFSTSTSFAADLDFFTLDSNLTCCQNTNATEENQRKASRVK